MVTPRYLQVAFGSIWHHSVSTLAVRSCRVLALVKCVSWNLSGANFDAWVVAQQWAFPRDSASLEQVSVVLFPRRE